MSVDEEFSAFVALRSTRLLRVASLLCSGDIASGEDLLQDALVEVYKRWSSVRDAEARDAYTRRVLVRMASKRWRLRARRDPSPLTLLDDASARRHDPDLAVDMREALRALPAEQRAVIVLRYYEDLTEAQIAAAMGCPVGTVKSRASLALKKLAQLLDTDSELSSGGRERT